MQKQAAYSITGAPKSLQDDVRSRETRYLLSMGLRTACFLLAIFAADGLLRWVLIVAAVVLPYIAVVMANAGRERKAKTMTAYVPNDRPELPRAAHRLEPGASDVIEDASSRTTEADGQGVAKNLQQEVRRPH